MRHNSLVSSSSIIIKHVPQPLTIHRAPSTHVYGCIFTSPSFISSHPPTILKTSQILFNPWPTFDNLEIISHVSVWKMSSPKVWLCDCRTAKIPRWDDELDGEPRWRRVGDIDDPAHEMLHEEIDPVLTHQRIRWWWEDEVDDTTHQVESQLEFDHIVYGR